MNEKKETLAEAVVEAARSAFLAGIGAAISIEEGAERLLNNTRKELADNVTRIAREAEKRFDEFVDRGRAYRAQGHKPVAALGEAAEEAVERSERAVDKLTEGTEARIRSAVSDVLHRLDIPTAADVRALAERVEKLQQQVDSLAEAGTT